MVKTRELGLNSLFLENQPNQTGIKLEIRSFYITNWKTGQIDKPTGYHNRVGTTLLLLFSLVKGF